MATLVSNYLTHSLTHSLTPWHLVDLTDVSLANSKLEVVTVADVDAEKRVDDSWCRFGHKAKFLFRL